MEKDKIFDNVNDNFHKICTSNGIDKDALQEFIVNSIKLMPDEDRNIFAENLIFEIINWCSFNFYEGLGIMEAAKDSYIKAFYSMMFEEMQNEQDDDEDDDDKD